MDLLSGLDLASSISKNFSLSNIVPFSIIAIIIFCLNAKWCLKYTGDKHIEVKITAVFVVLILAAEFNIVVNKLSSNLLSVFCKNTNDLLMFIVLYILIICNLMLIFCYSKFNNIIKKRWIDLKYAAMPIFAFMLYWSISVIFICFKWDLKYLYNGIGGKISGFIFIIISIVIPILKSFFSAENYKTIIYMKGFKMPIRLHENTELLINNSMYTIDYYNIDKSKIIRKDSIPEREVYRIIEHYDM